MNNREAKREAQMAQNNKEELFERIARVLPEDGTLDPFPGFRLARSSRPTEPVRSVYQPAFCFVAQGRKQALLGEELFRYDPGHYLIYTIDLHTRRISRAIGRLRKNFDQPLRMNDIARDLGMSVSGFHHHFKSVTAMSPLQFQKQIRLQEARRLMLGEDLDAATAGFLVGYEDPA